MIDTTAITAITPITIPSSVSSDRRRLARREDSAIKMASTKFMISNGVRKSIYPPTLHITCDPEFCCELNGLCRTFPEVGGFFPPSSRVWRAAVWSQRAVSEAALSVSAALAAPAFADVPAEAVGVSEARADAPAVQQSRLRREEGLAGSSQLALPERPFSCAASAVVAVWAGLLSSKG